MIRSGRPTQRIIGGGIAALIVAGIAVAVFKPPPTTTRAASSARPAPQGTASKGFGLPTGAQAGSGGGASPSGASSTPAAGVPSVGPAATPPTAPADTVVRNGSLDIQVERGKFSSGFSAAADVARQTGGFVVTAQMGPSGGPPPTVQPAVSGFVPAVDGSQVSSGPPTSGTLVLRVPGARFDDARRQLEGIGRVGQEQLSGQDAGGQLTDFQARLADLHAQQAALRTMAARTRNSADLLAIQGQLAAVQQQIDALTTQLNALQNQVTLASITVTVHEPFIAAAGPPSILSSRLVQARRGIESVLGGILVVLAYVGPVAVLTGLGALIIVGLRRRRLARVAVAP